MEPWGKGGVDSMSLGMHVGRIARPLGLSLLAVGVAAASAGAVSAHQPTTSPVSSATAVERAMATPIRTQQLVFPKRGFYLRLTPGSGRRPARILPVEQMEPEAMAGSGHRVFWLQQFRQTTFGSSIRKVSVTGQHPITLVRRVHGAFLLAATRHHVFWATSGAIGRVSVDGSRVQRRWLVGIRRQADGIIVDGMATDRRFLYLSQCFRGRIGRVPLAARPRHRQVEWIVRGIDTCPAHLEVSGGFIYWSGDTKTGAGPGVIGRAPSAGGAPTQIWTRIRSFGGPLSIVAVNGFVYWDWSTSGPNGKHFIGRVSDHGTRFVRKLRRVSLYPITAVSR